MNILKNLMEMTHINGELRGKISALESEIEFLRGLLKDKIARSAIEPTEPTQAV